VLQHKPLKSQKSILIRINNFIRLLHSCYNIVTNVTRVESEKIILQIIVKIVTSVVIEIG
jgi:hypothetical protein